MREELGKAVSAASENVISTVRMTEAQLSTCAVCGCKLTVHNRVIVEDLERYEGIVACKSHTRIATNAIHEYQERGGVCYVQFSEGQPADRIHPPMEIVCSQNIPVKFGLPSGELQSAYVTCPAHLYYCPVRNALETACLLRSGEKVNVSIGNLRRHTPDLKAHFVFMPFEDASASPNPWRTRWMNSL